MAVPLMVTELPPSETGSGVAGAWARAAARLEPKIVIRVPGAMEGRKLAELRIPLKVTVGVRRAMVKASAFDVAPSPATVTLAVPAVAMRAAGTLAVNWEALTNVVASGAPFHCTLELAVKPAPVTVRVKAAPPGAAALGLRLAREAAGVVEMDSTSSLEETGPSLKTLILALPGAAIKAADTSAVTCVALTRVVGRAAPFRSEYEFVGGDRAIIEDTDFGAAGRGDQGGGHQRGHLRGAHSGSGQSGAVPGHGGAGEEVAACGGKGEIRAAHQCRCGAEAGDGRGSRLHGKNGRLGGNQRARIDHLDDVRPRLRNGARGHADGKLVHAHIGCRGAVQADHLRGRNK